MSRPVPVNVTPAASRLDLTPEWQRAIERVAAGEMRVSTVFQPIVDLHRGCTAGYEALSRFEGPPAGGPDAWLARAEAMGLGLAVERRCLESALRSLPALPPNTFLSINVSPSLLGSPDWAALIGSHTRLDRLVVEVTEHAAIEDYGGARRALAEARGRGALFAVDDAGSGYASMQHVVALRPEFVKVDRLFVTNCGRDSAKAALIEALGSLAANLDAWIVAEGVEDDDELACLLRLGVPLAQGYRLARPAPVWQEPAADAQVLIGSFRRRAEDVSQLTALLEECPVTRGLAHQAIPLSLTLVVDEHGRPQRWSGRGVRPAASRPLLIKATTPIKAAVRRAMVRAEAERFLPVVCTDDEGCFVGIVRIERILEYLAAS